MIRKLQKTDIDYVIHIWLDTNLKAHDFIDASYWKSNFELVKEMLMQAEVYVYVDQQNNIVGFIGMKGTHIEGIFVLDGRQSCGIGKRLLNFVKNKKQTLFLNVYQKNFRAKQFYKREGFEIMCETVDVTTQEKEYEMRWMRKCR